MMRLFLLVLFSCCTAACCSWTGKVEYVAADPQQDWDLLELGNPNRDAAIHENWFRVKDPHGVWQQHTDETGPYYDKQALIAACEGYLKRTNRRDERLSGYTSHARLWVFIYGPSDPNALGGGITLFVDSKHARVVAETDAN